MYNIKTPLRGDLCVYSTIKGHKLKFVKLLNPKNAADIWFGEFDENLFIKKILFASELRIHQRR